MSILEIKGKAEETIYFRFVSCPFEVYAMDHTVRRQPITRARLAYDVARNVKKFLEVRCWPTKYSTFASGAIILEGEGGRSR